MVLLQVLFAGLYNRTDGVPLAALLARGYYENRNRAKGRTRGVMTGNTLNITGVRCGGFIPRKVLRFNCSGRVGTDRRLWTDRSGEKPVSV